MDIDRLTEAELINLNHHIVARLRLLNQMRAHMDAGVQPSVEDILTRYNKNTVTVVAGGGRQRSIPPAFLTKVAAATHGNTAGSKTMLLSRN
jgi:hypothetical protein